MSLQNVDIGIVVLYLVGVLVFGIWIGRREKADRKGFFLGGRNFSWLLIGTSLFATNISSVQFVGQSGLAYKIGIAAANPQLTGVICLALSAVYWLLVDRLGADTVIAGLGLTAICAGGTAFQSIQ